MSLGKQNRIEKGRQDRSLVWAKVQRGWTLLYMFGTVPGAQTLLLLPHVSLVMSCRTSHISSKYFIISSQVKDSPQ